MSKLKLLAAALLLAFSTAAIAEDQILESVPANTLLESIRHVVNKTECFVDNGGKTYCEFQVSANRIFLSAKSNTGIVGIKRGTAKESQGLILVVFDGDINSIKYIDLKFLTVINK